MFDLNYKGVVWGYAFLRGDSRTNLGEKERLLLEAIDMYYLDEEKRYVQGDSYEGVVTTERKWGLIGSFGGQVFDAEVDTNSGRSHLRFLVQDRTGFAGEEETAH